MSHKSSETNTDASSISQTHTAANIVNAKIESVPYEHWLNLAYDEYKNTFFNVRGRQIDIIKTYLWLCSAILSFELYMVNEILLGRVAYIKQCHVAYIVIIELVSIAFAVIAFLLAIKLLRLSKGKELFPFSFSGDGNDAVSYFKTTSFEQYCASNISSIHNAIQKERELIAHDGIILRKICILILSSFCTQFVAALALAIFTIL